MKVLIVDNTAFVGENIKKGLEMLYHYDVTLDDNISWRDSFGHKYNQEYFDIIHVNSPNFKKLATIWNYLRDGTKLVCHWHGSDLRHPVKCFPVYRWLQVHADMNLYSTLDLRWWIKYSDKKMLFNCPVDTDVFQPDSVHIKHGHTRFVGGGQSFNVHRISHSDMPRYLNQFETVDIINADGLDDGLLSVIALEAASVDCKINQLPWLNRDWVIDNASILSQTKQLVDVYNDITRS